jgi:hypothetical protein
MSTQPHIEVRFTPEFKRNSKTEQSDITPTQLRRILKELE